MNFAKQLALKFTIFLMGLLASNPIPLFAAPKYISDEMVITLAESKKSKITADQFFDFLADTFNVALKEIYIDLLQDVAKHQKEGIKKAHIARMMRLNPSLSKEAAEKEFDRTWTPRKEALMDFERDIHSIKITNSQDRKQCMLDFAICIKNLLQHPVGVSSEQDKPFKNALREQLYKWLSKQ